MIQSLWEGVSMGLLLSAIVGPVFFTLIQNSMEHGFRYAAVLASGILLSDTVYVILTFFGIKFLAEAIYFQLILGYVGGLILIGFGISSLLKKKISRPNTGGIEIPTTRKRTAFAKGFGVNGVNPFVLLFWISIASLVSTKDLWQGADIRAYYFGILLTVFAIDLIKAFLAKQLSHIMTPRLMWLLNKAVGLVMIFFGLRLIWHTFGS
ncbi:Threonine/homoserine/homoserine lactone efflux protein [Algoriphagus alkaliphilus]|uniref:Threonine/homoserine/homoserine lactone efflux protein n=1 Tax=Algoriphagus alkaliphilus TaxID=279824 RepID=A0A1G5ZLT5_9BACT|nr:LysE family translocator [Algoriphagus alkaliphilus]MBA4299901.1 LysE family translocator [Cyclobacterium sp.]SDA95486.1 Threonine/homoserine/homoserine lactone efflux protein [Algoriphagus alkaliphilus]